MTFSLVFDFLMVHVHVQAYDELELAFYLSIILGNQTAENINASIPHDNASCGCNNDVINSYLSKLHLHAESVRSFYEIRWTIQGDETKHNRHDKSGD